jgi:hypothetical protein
LRQTLEPEISLNKVDKLDTPLPVKETGLESNEARV